MNTESIHKIAQEIRKDIGLLRDKHLYELERIPGNAKCSTHADRMEEKIDYIIDSYEEMLKIRARLIKSSLIFSQGYWMAWQKK